MAGRQRKMTSALRILIISALLIGKGKVVLSAEPKIILQSGQEGRIPCGLETDLQSLTWKRGQTYEEANDIITLTRENGSTTTIKSEETSYEIDEDNSLIITYVSKEDRGWYYCQLTDLQNITDSTDHAVLVQSVESLPGHIVSTEPQISLTTEEQGLITCRVQRSFYTLYWKKGPTYSDAETLVILDLYFNVGEKTGAGFEEGQFDITQNYSLLIKNVEKEDEGRYFCEVYDLETGLLVKNQTDLTIFSAEDFPTTAKSRDRTTDGQELGASTNKDDGLRTSTSVDAKTTITKTHRATHSTKTAIMTSTASGSTGPSIILIVVVCVAGLIGVFIVVAICCCVRSRRKKKREEEDRRAKDEKWISRPGYELVNREPEEET